ncbi:MAG: YfgM family protein [Gammaproteobacteria bacterium]
MTELTTDEQQAEALKAWWRENGKSVITGVVLGIGIILGWQGWQKYTTQRSEAASIAFQQLLVALDSDEGAVAQGERLIAEYDNTPYAIMASMALAKVHMGQGEMDKAISRLEWARDKASQAGIAEIARLRLAKVKLASGDADAALAELEGEAPAGMEGAYAEVRGDAYRAKGDFAAAAEAYDQAIAALGDGNIQAGIIRIKRDELGTG